MIHRVNSDGDQKLLDEIVEKSVGTEYKILTDSQKRDYRQFAYELLSISLSAKEKGYKINLKINNDEHENVKNIGNLIHVINTLKDSYFNEITQEEYAQLEFYNSILKKALGNNYDSLDKRDKRDYQQILYELLPEEKKKYVIDPIDLDKQIKNSNDIVIGDN